MKKLRLGIVGCGSHALKSHIQNAVEAGFRLTAVSDPKPEHMNGAIAASRCRGVQKFPSLAELLNSGLVDALVIASPDKFHPEQLTQAVEARVPVLVEKPLAINLQGLATIHGALSLAARTNVPVTSCHPRRFDPPYMWIKANLQRLVEEYGRLIRIEQDFAYSVPGTDWKHDRSLMMDHAPHEIDFLRMLLGNQTIHAYLLSDSYDRYSAVGLIGGVEFTCTGTRMLRRKDAYPERIFLRFAGGECTVDTETGWAAIRNYNTLKVREERAGRTDHKGRVTGVMHDFAGLLKTGHGALTLADLLANTEVPIQLAVHGRYTT